HLGIQYADKMGFETVAISRGTEKGEVAAALGARAYIDSTITNPGSELQKRGGATVIFVTAPDAKAIGPLRDGLAAGGKLNPVAGIVEPIGVPGIQLIQKRLSIVGWPSGTSKDSEDALRFTVLTGVRPIVESFSFDRLTDAYRRTVSGEARFRSVVEIGK